jgi:tetratricopeptide (TPR) repeat protein
MSRETSIRRYRELSGRARIALLGAAIVLGIGTAFVAVAIWRVQARPDPDRIWREAEANIRVGRTVQAEALLARLSSLRQAKAEDWVLRAQVSVARERFDEALASLRQVPAQHPLAAEAWFMTGRIERQSHRLRHAEAAFRRAIELEPGLVKAHKELVYLFGVQLRRRDVDAEFKALSRLTTLSHHDLFTWCVTHFSVWAPDIADDLESFIKADPLDRFSRLALAKLLVDKPGMENRVERTLDTLPPSDLAAAAIRIELRLNHGRISEAVALLDQSPRHRPELARLRGRIALMRGDVASAIDHFKNALSDEPYDRVSLSELGRALLIKGEKTSAAIYLAQARRLDDVYNFVVKVRRPDQENRASDPAHLGRLCEAAGLLAEARGWYLLAIARDPLDAQAQQALWRLREAGSQRVNLLAAPASPVTSITQVDASP